MRSKSIYTRISLTPPYLRLRRNPQTLRLPIENNILAPKQHIPINLQVRPSIALDAPKARVRIHLRKRHGRSGNHGHVGAHCDAKVGEGGGTGVGVAAYCGGGGGATDLGVVGLGYLGVY